MKPVEDAFASETFRRVILPGIVLASGVHPLIAKWAPRIASQYGVGSTVLLVAEVIFFGLAVSSVIQWIYYIYEGFRLRPLTALAHKLNKRRLKTLRTSFDQLQNVQNPSPSEENRLYRVYGALLDFPLKRLDDGSVVRCAERPTRLGNIIAVYELYPRLSMGSILFFTGLTY